MNTNEAYKKYQSDLGENAARIVLSKFSNLTLIKIPRKKDKQTPDYEIKNASGDTIAFCEVKSLVDSLTEDFDVNISVEKYRELSQKIDKKRRNKIRKHLGEAINQLKEYSHLPTLVFFASHDMSDGGDLGYVLQEHKELHPDDQIPDYFIIMKIYQKIIPSDTFEIKYMIQNFFDSDRGKEFGEKYLASNEVIKRTGLLPLTFKLS